MNIEALGVQKVDNAIHWVNLSPLEGAIGFPNTYPVDSVIQRQHFSLAN